MAKINLVKIERHSSVGAVVLAAKLYDNKLTILKDLDTKQFTSQLDTIYLDHTAYNPTNNISANLKYLTSFIKAILWQKPAPPVKFHLISFSFQFFFFLLFSSKYCQAKNDLYFLIFFRHLFFLKAMIFFTTLITFLFLIFFVNQQKCTFYKSITIQIIL